MTISFALSISISSRKRVAECNGVSPISEIELIEDRLFFSIDVNFRYQSNCGRCLTASNNEDRSSFSTTLNIKEDNDYEINYDDEYFDLSPFISEIIIEKMDINFVCSQKCKGLCSYFGEL